MVSGESLKVFLAESQYREGKIRKIHLVAEWTREAETREKARTDVMRIYPVVAITWCRVGNHDENTNFSPLKCQNIQLMQKVYWNDALENIK